MTAWLAADPWSVPGAASDMPQVMQAKPAEICIVTDCAPAAPQGPVAFSMGVARKQQCLGDALSYQDAQRAVPRSAPVRLRRAAPRAPVFESAKLAYLAPYPRQSHLHRLQQRDGQFHLRLAETLTGFLARLRSSAETLDIAERQRIVRLIVKEVLVTEDKITIRSFREKRDAKRGFRNSPLRLNEDLRQAERWDEPAIRARAARLADLAVEIWRRPVLTGRVLAPAACRARSTGSPITRCPLPPSTTPEPSTQV